MSIPTNRSDAPTTPHRPRTLGHSILSAALCLGAAVMSLSLPLSAQGANESFTESIDVRVVNLEVVITDRAGNRIEGLGPEDFELIVDGATTPIDYFSEIRDREVVSETLRSDPSTRDVSVVQPALEAGTTIGTHYLIFIDEHYAIGAHRDFALDAILTQISELGPADRMAIVAFDGKTLTQLTGWNGSPSELRSTLEGAKERKTWGLMRRSVRAARGIESIPGSEGLELEREVVAIVSTLQSFADVPGRKVAMLLAGRWPAKSLSNRQPDAGDEFLDDETTDLTITRPIIEVANTLGYTLYPVDLPGLQESRSGVDQIEAAGVDAIPTPPTTLNTDLFRQGALRRIADDTGGRTILGSDRQRILERVQEDTASYYWLGFTSKREFDDSAHSIIVRAKDRGLEVRTRRGYRDLSRQAEVTMALQGSLLFVDQAAPNRLAVRLGSPTSKGLSRMELPIDMIIPLDDVFLIPRGSTFVSQLELRIAAVDESGALADIPVVPIVIEAKSRPEQGRGLLHSVTVTLRKTPQRLAIALTDPVGGKTFASTVEVASFKSLREGSTP